MEKCNVCKGEIEEISGFCECTKQVKYIIECHDCGCEFVDYDWINNPKESTIHTKGQCNDCWEWEVENLK